jgi:hypothetical protein
VHGGDKKCRNVYRKHEEMRYSGYEGVDGRDNIEMALRDIGCK